MYHFVHKEALLAQREKHAIRRDVGRFFLITVASKVCSLHLKRTDLSKDLNWWTFVCQNRPFFLRIFLEKASPRKRNPLPEMPCQQQWGKCQLADSLSLEHEILVNKTPEAENDIRETGTNSITKLQRRQNSLKLTLIQLKKCLLLTTKIISVTLQINLGYSMKNAQTLKIRFRIWKARIERLVQTPSLSIGSFFWLGNVIFYTGFLKYKAFLAT